MIASASRPPNHLPRGRGLCRCCWLGGEGRPRLLLGWDEVLLLVVGLGGDVKGGGQGGQLGVLTPMPLGHRA